MSQENEPIPVFIPGEQLPSGLPCLIGDDEELVRFLKSKKYFSVENNIVKAAAFLPNPSDGQTSVFRRLGAPADTLWEKGRKEIGEAVSIYGAGLISASSVRAASLAVNALEPPPAHANIEEWPSHDDPELTKAAQKAKAIALAEHTKLLLPPSE